MNTGEITFEHLLPLSDAARRLPRRKGKKVHYSTLYRWATKGVRGRRLETVVVGGLRYTTWEALMRFISPRGPASSYFTPDPLLYECDFEQVDAALDEAGL